MSSKTKAPKKTPAKRKQPADKKPPAKKETKRKRDQSDYEDDDEFEDIEENSQNEDEIKLEDDESDNELEAYYEDDKAEGEYDKFQKYNRDKAWKLKKIFHHLLPAFNMIPMKTDFKELRDFPLAKLSVPHAIYVNPKLSDAVDICHRRTIALYSYMHRLRMVKRSYENVKKKHKIVRKNEKRGIYDKSIIEFARRKEFHPDKFFEQDYDFYYTGGNLSVNSRSNQIAYVAGTHMNTLVLSAINVVDSVPQVHKIISVDFKGDDEAEREIFELQHSFSDDEYIFMRQKLNISILKLNADNEEITAVQNFKSKTIPFISLSQDPVETNHLAITDLMHKIRLCDIEQGVPIRTIKMMAKEDIKPVNNWNMIKSLDRNVYVYASNKKVSLIDSRLPDGEWPSNICATTPETECYSFCSLARSKFENLFYIGANHKAYCVDRRFMNRDVDNKKSTVVCWTHQMSSFPLMMATACHNDVEYLTLQSPLSSDLRICELMQSAREPKPEPEDDSSIKRARLDLQTKYIYKAPCLPYMPPSIEILYTEARWEGKCLNPTSGMNDRVKACMTGLDFLHKDSVSYLLTASTNGDLFARSLYNPANTDIKPDMSTACDVMSYYEENILQTVPKPPLNVTEVVDLKGLRNVFLCDKLSYDEQSDYNLPRKRKYLGRWQKSIARLAKYKDALAADLMAPWDFKIEEDSFDLGALDQSLQPKDKVSGWLEKSEDIVNSTMMPMTTIPMEVLNESSIANVTAVTEVANESTVTVTDDVLNDSKPIDLDQTTTASISKPKTAKKKTRYVKGF